MYLQSLMKLQLFLLCLSPNLSDVLADLFKIAFYVVRYGLHKIVCMHQLMHLFQQFLVWLYHMRIISFTVNLVSLVTFRRPRWGTTYWTCWYSCCMRERSSLRIFLTLCSLTSLIQSRSAVSSTFFILPHFYLGLYCVCWCYSIVVIVIFFYSRPIDLCTLLLLSWFVKLALTLSLIYTRWVNQNARWF